MAVKGLQEILDSIDELSNRGKISRQRAFAAWFAVNFYDLDEDEALEAASADGGNDQGIDIAFYDESNDEIVVLQAHCPENFSKVTQKGKWDALISCIPFVKKPKNLLSAGGPDLAESLEDLREKHVNSTILLGLITLGMRSSSIKSSFDAHSAEPDKDNIAYLYFAQEDIISKYETADCGRSWNS